MIGWIVELISLDADIIASEYCDEWWEVEEAVEKYSHTLDFNTSIMISVVDGEDEVRWTTDV